MNIGEIDLDLVLNSDEFRGEVRNIQSEANIAGTKISSAFSKIGKAVSAAFSVAAVTSFVKAVTKSAAEVQAANSQFVQTFGSMSNSARDAMKKVADESGIVQSRLQGVGTSIFAFAKTTGMDSASALSMMQEALQVTADSAAYYDRSLEDTAESLKAFLKGNYANDAALGLSCTETTRNTAANKLYGKSFKELSEAQKQLTLLQMVKDANAASGALGQAARESDGLENVLGNLKETWNQFLAVIGKPVLKAAVVVIQNITTALGHLIDAAKYAVDELGKLFGWETDEEQNGMQATGDAIATSVENQEALTEEVKKTNKEVERGTASFDKLNVISQSGGDNEDDASDVSGVGSTPFTAIEQSSEKAADSISDRFQSIFQNFYETSGFKTFVEKVKGGINSVDWSAIGENCKSIINSSIPIAITSFDQMKEVGSSAMGAVGSAVSSMITTSGKAAQTVTGGISTWLRRDQGKIQSFIKTIGGNFTTGFNNLSKFFDGWGAVVGGSIDRMRPRVEDAIADLLSGVTDLAGGIGTVLSGAFAEGTRALSDWIENDAPEISLFLDNLQSMGADVLSFIGDVFGDIGNDLSEWWNGDGQEIFGGICDAFTDIGTTLMNVWNDWIKPAWDAVVGALQSAWDDCLEPVFGKLLEFFGKVGELFSAIWNFLSPVVNWLVDFFGPIFTNVFGAIGEVFETFFSIVGEVVGGIIDAFGGVIDFLTGVFTGDWDKAWGGICSIFEGIWNAIWSILKGVINLIIDALNLLWTVLYSVVAAIVNAVGGLVKWIGSIFGADDWGWEMSWEAPKIPHIEEMFGDGEVPALANGGIVTAPTLALVGDNSGAGSGNPEVVAPLDTLRSMMTTSETSYDVSLLSSILDYLKRFYELFVLFRNEGGNSFEFIMQLNGETVFEDFVERVNIYKQRHNGDLPF